MNSVNEWLHLHDLDPGIVWDCLSAVANQSIDIDLANFPHSDQDFAIAEFSSLPTALKEAVQPALTALLHPCNIGPLIEAIRWSQNDVADNTPPHTVDHGVDHPPPKYG